MTETDTSELSFMSNGYSIFYRCWMPTDTPKFIFVLVHGFGEHSGRYQEFALTIINKGIAVYALDLRGHGLSQGRRGHIPHISHYLDDIEELLKIARVDHTEIPIILFGHSMGGTLVLQFIKKRIQMEITGFIVSSPWISLAIKIPFWKLKLGRALEKIIPQFLIPNDLDARDLSHLEHIIDGYNNDPLVLRKISLRLFSEMEKITAELINNPFSAPIPGLIYCGSNDSIINSSVTKQLFQNLPKVYFELLDNTKHEPHNDLDNKKLFTLIEKWVETLHDIR